MEKKIPLLSFVIFFSFIIFAKNIKIENGIYWGDFYQSKMFYELNDGEVKPLGTSFFDFNEKIIIEKNCFFLKFNKISQTIICDKIEIKKEDYTPAILNSKSEFNGLHYGPLIYEKEYKDGILFAIKTLKDSTIVITIFKFEDFILYKTKGKIYVENKNGKNYKKLTFTVFGEINNYKQEEWVLTYNWVTDYRYDNFFNVYINDKYRFQVEVIDNGIK